MNRSVGLTFNTIFERYMFIIIPVSLILGFLFSNRLSGWVEIIPWLFAFITLVMGWGCSIKKLLEVLKHPVSMIVLFVLAHVVTTLIAYGIGCMIFGSSSPYVIGLVLFAAIPMGISSALWVGLSSGSVPWIVSMIVLDSLLSPVVVPMTMHALFGATLELNGGDIRNKLFFIIVLPTLVGVLVNEMTKGRVNEWAAPVSAPLSKIAFVGVVMLNASAIAPEMNRLQGDVWILIPVVVGFVALCYLIGYVGAYLMRGSGIFVEFSYASGMRNISLGVVIGLGYFSPLASIPVVLAILVQQPMATLNYYFHRRLQNLNNKKLENQ